MNRLSLYFEDHEADNIIGVDWSKYELEDVNDVANQFLPQEWNRFVAKWDDALVETSDPLLEVNLGTIEVLKVTYISIFLDSILKQIDRLTNLM